MTANAEALKKIIERRIAITKKLDVLSQRLANLDSVSLSQSIPKTLEALEINQDDYYSLDEVNKRIERNERFAKVNGDAQDLRGKVVDVVVALNRDEAFLKPLTEQLHNLSDEDKRLQEEEENAGLQLKLIKDELYSLLPTDLSTTDTPPLEQDPLDWLVNLVTQQLKLGNITVKAVEKLNVFSQYLSIKWEKPSAFYRSTPSVVFSKEGENLKNYVASYEDRLKNLEAAQASAIKSLDDSLAIKETQIKEFQEALSIHEIAFVRARQEIIDHFLESKKSAEKVCEIIQQARSNIDAARQQLELVAANGYSISHLSHLNKIETIDTLETAARDIEESIKKISEPCDLLQAYANVARMKLVSAKELCKKNEGQYGKARIWTKLSKTIDKKQNASVAEMLQIAAAQKASLSALKDCANSVNNRIKELKKQKLDLLNLSTEELQPESSDMQVEVKPDVPDGLVTPDPKTEVEAIDRYQRKTVYYAEDLTRDIKDRLTDFKRSAKTSSKQGLSYQLLINTLKIESADPTVDEISHCLKQIYDVDVDSNEVALNQRNLIAKMLENAEQRPIKIALEKYNVLTRGLKELKEKGSRGFLSVLKDKKNQEILNTHRDRSFMAFIRGCGARVMALFSRQPTVGYGGMFYQPKGKRYAHDIIEITKEVSAKRARVR